MKGSEIPDRWPLKRPITSKEWQQILKAMIIRRVPAHTPIPEDALARMVDEDIRAAASLIVAEKNFHGYMGEDYVKRKVFLLTQDGRLHLAMMGVDDANDGKAIMGVYRTERSQEILDLLPIALRKVLDYLPITNLTEWLAWEAVEPESLDD